MWLDVVDSDLDGTHTVTRLGERWHVLPDLATLASVQAGLGVWRRRFPGVTLKGFEFVPFDQYAQVTLTTTTGITWSASSAKPRHKAPRNKPTRQLYRFLDPLIRDALDHPYSVSAPIPITAAYALGGMVPAQKSRHRRDWYADPQRLGDLDSSLFHPSMLFDGLYWLTHVQDLDRRAKIKMGSFDYQLPTLVIWESAVASMGLPFQVEPLNMHGLVDLMRVQWDHGTRGWVSHKLPDLPLAHLQVLGFVLDLVRRCVQVNPPDGLEDSVRGLNSSGVVLVRRWDALKHTGLLDEEKLQKVFPNLQFLVTDLEC